MRSGIHLWRFSGPEHRNPLAWLGSYRGARKIRLRHTPDETMQLSQPANRGPTLWPENFQRSHCYLRSTQFEKKHMAGFDQKLAHLSET